MTKQASTRIARKELLGFFSSPVAFVFFAAFLAVTLFIFFWVSTFFARNIADVRPLFEWMPILLIFLVAAITMRMWSDERHMGTIEFVLTLPVSPLQFVLGKFMACLALVGIALLLTLPIPFTVSLLGPLDWGPVLAGYLATMFLAGAYAAVGLYVSSKNDNQIVSLIGTVAVCTVLYLLGSEALTPFLGNRGSELIRLFGTGSRFSSITRGVIDLRDLYYYLSIVGIFLSLNVLGLETMRWSKENEQPLHRRWRLLTFLLVANFLIGNFWLSYVRSARIDVTRGKLYSISASTRAYLSELREPLLIRGYFSAKTHPLLAPLVPQLRDLILEYQVAGGGNVRAEFVDPADDPELEQEAGQKYGIRPVPFQVADKYQSALVNSYFDILIQYGDQYEVLDFRDLIEVKAQDETHIDVELRNPEYDITRTIKKVLYGFQGAGDLFANMTKPVRFEGYISPDAKLPPFLVEFKGKLDELLKELQETSKGKFSAQIEDPTAGGGELANKLSQEFGFNPMRAGLLDTNTFYFYMTLQSGDQIVQVPLPESFEKADLRRSLEAGLKRFSKGFLKTVAIYTPPPLPPDPTMEQMGMAPPRGKQFTFLSESLRENHNLREVTLRDGVVPEESDLLLVVAPSDLDAKQVFAIDQFLMKGGTVVLATSPYVISTQYAGLSAAEHASGLDEWLAHQGIQIEKAMVLDPQNEAFPLPITRNLGGFSVQEIQMMDYPYFVDIRGKGLNSESLITSGLPEVTLNWASPIRIDKEKGQGRRVTHLLESSPDAWLTSSPKILPELRQGRWTFEPGSEHGRQLLGVTIEGHFDSFFKDKPNPLLEASSKQRGTNESAQAKPPLVASLIEKSADSARIILFPSNEFLADQTLQISQSVGGSSYLNAVALIENAIDASLEDPGLLAIRSRGHFSRTLAPIEKQQQMFWEYLDYGLCLAGLGLVYLAYRASRSKIQAHERAVFLGKGV